MTRYHATVEGNVPFTPEEEAEFDAMEAAELLRYKGPASVSMRQARLALLAAGLLDDVNAGITSMGQAAQIEWEYASEVRRDSTLVAGMVTLLGMTSEQLDQLFITAVTL